MNKSSKVGVAIVILIASSVLLLLSTFPMADTLVLLVAAALATSGLAAGALLMGSTGTEGRLV